MSYKPSYLAHVNLRVHNVELSQKWYTDVLGLHTYEYRPGRAAFLSANRDLSHEIALMQIETNPKDFEDNRIGLNHMAWMMASLEDLKEFYLRIKAQGVEIDRIVDHGISLGIYLRDPDGHGIEVTYELPRNQWARQDQVFEGDGIKKGLFPGPLYTEFTRVH